MARLRVTCEPQYALRRVEGRGAGQSRTFATKDEAVRAGRVEAEDRQGVDHHPWNAPQRNLG
jgi:hypothetical protein